jgi:hypothetical protein
MNKLSLLSALLLAAGVATAQTQATNDGAAAAGSGQQTTPQQDRGAVPAPSVEDRGAVRADRDAARDANTLPRGEQSVPAQDRLPQGAQATAADAALDDEAAPPSRDQVRAEAEAAIRSGAIPDGQESVKGQNKGHVEP